MKDCNKLVVYGIMAIVIIVSAYLCIGLVSASYDYSYGNCFDTDSELDIYIKGIVGGSDNGMGVNWSDMCVGGDYPNTLYQVSCRYDNEYIVNPYECPNGCLDGVCINLNITLPENQTETNETCPVCPVTSCPSCSCGGSTKTIYKNNTIVEYKYLYSEPKCEESICNCNIPTNDTSVSADSFVEVGKPFYKNIWFYGCIILGIILLIGIFWGREDGSTGN